MFGVFRLIKSVISLNSRLAEDERSQMAEGYSIKTLGNGPETYITYVENEREIGLLVEFSIYNDVVLFTDSLRKWTKPFGVELTPLDYQKVLNRATHYLSCWGTVTYDETRLLDNEDLKKSLTEQGIDFTDLDDVIISYTVEAEVARHHLKQSKRY